MSEVKEFVGIDIAKKTFDVYNPRLGSVQFANNPEGFEAFTKQMINRNCCVMDALGRP